LSVTNPVLAWLRDRFMLAVRNLPSVRDYVLQMKFKPMPRFSRGVVLGAATPRLDERVGRMFVQPPVERADGATVKLDEALGAGFALLAWQHDPGPALPAATRAALGRLGCRVLAAARSRSLQAMQLKAAPSPGVEVVEDAENALHLWFAACGADWVLLRPDRYVAALGTRASLAGGLETFLHQWLPPGDGHGAFAPSSA
jgi:3-(3-hydroxy-phenyl)propionate hydroxylase